MTEFKVGTLKIQVDISGMKTAISSLKTIRSEVNNLSNTGGIKSLLGRLNVLRWGLLAVQEITSVIGGTFKTGFALAGTTVKIVGGIVNIALIKPLQLIAPLAVKAAKAIGGIAAATAVISVKKFADIEDQLASVGRTTDLEGEKLTLLKNEIFALGKETRTPIGDLLSIAESAGQLGIESNNISGFVEAINKVAVATDTTAAVAAKAFGRGAGVFNLDTSRESILAMGNAVNILGNTTSASTEEIIKGISNAAQSTSLLGVSFADTSGLVATAIAEGFLPAAKAGTSIGRVFDALATDTESIAEIVGVSAESFRELIDQDALGALKQFLTAASSGGSAAETLGKLIGETGLRATKSAATFINSWGELEKNLKTANDEFQNGNSVLREAERQENTLNGTIGRLNNSITILRNNIGEALAPTVSRIVSLFETFVVIAGPKLVDIFTALGRGAEALAGGIFTLGKNLLNQISSSQQFSNIMIRVKSVFSDLTSGGVISSLSTTLSSVISIVLSLADAFNSVTDGIDLPQTFSNLASAIQTVAQSLQGELGQRISTFYTTIGSLIGTVANKISEVITLLFNSDGGGSAFGRFAELLTNIIAGTKEFISSLSSEKVAVYIGQIGDALSAIFQIVSVSFAVVIPLVLNLLSLLSSATFIKTVQAVILAIGSVLNLVVGIVRVFFNVLDGIIGAILKLGELLIFKDLGSDSFLSGFFSLQKDSEAIDKDATNKQDFLSQSSIQDNKFISDMQSTQGGFLSGLTQIFDDVIAALGGVASSINNPEREFSSGLTPSSEVADRLGETADLQNSPLSLLSDAALDNFLNQTENQSVEGISPEQFASDPRMPSNRIGRDPEENQRLQSIQVQSMSIATDVELRAV